MSAAHTAHLSHDCGDIMVDAKDDIDIQIYIDI